MKIVSGGQTGVDRAALDFAIRNGIEHGGWCPRGRLAEDGQIPDMYLLRPTASDDYSERTERNVIESDATLIITRDLELIGGTALTHRIALQHNQPVLVVSENDAQMTYLARLEAFFKAHCIRTLNVAGPRESEAPGIGGFAGTLLETVVQWLKK